MQAGKKINVQKHERPINKKSHKLGGTRLGKMDQQEVNFLVPSRVASCRNLKNTVHKKNNRRKKKTKESPPCVIHPKGGKGNARSKPEKGKDKTGSRNQILGSGVGYAKGRY
jgi:hypothetical protein